MGWFGGAVRIRLIGCGGWGRFGWSGRLVVGAEVGECFGEVPAGGGLAVAEVGGFPGGEMSCRVSVT